MMHRPRVLSLLLGLVAVQGSAMAQRAQLNYNCQTGNVSLDASNTTSGLLFSFGVGTDQNNFRPENLTNSADGSVGPFVDVGTNTDATTFQIGQTDPLNVGSGPIIDLGAIFPVEIADVGEYLNLAEYSDGLGSGGLFEINPRQCDGTLPTEVRVFRFVEDSSGDVFATLEVASAPEVDHISDIRVTLLDPARPTFRTTLADESVFWDELLFLYGGKVADDLPSWLQLDDPLIYIAGSELDKTAEIRWCNNGCGPNLFGELVQIPEPASYGVSCMATILFALTPLRRKLARTSADA